MLPDSRLSDLTLSTSTVYVTDLTIPPVVFRMFSWELFSTDVNVEWSFFPVWLRSLSLYPLLPNLLLRLGVLWLDGLDRYCFARLMKIGARNGSDETMFCRQLVRHSRAWFGDTTYSDVELNGAPEDQHGGVTVFRVLDSINLAISLDWTDCCEDSQCEDGDKTNLFCQLNLQLHQHWNRQNGNHNIRDDRNDGVSSEGWSGRKTLSLLEGIPRFVNLES